MSVFFETDGEASAYYQGRRHGAKASEAILLDLIAELRNEHWRDSAGFCAACDNKTCCVSTTLNRAEQRLKEITE